MQRFRPIGDHAAPHQPQSCKADSINMVKKDSFVWYCPLIHQTSHKLQPIFAANAKRASNLSAARSRLRPPRSGYAQAGAAPTAATSRSATSEISASPIGVDSPPEQFGVSSTPSPSIVECTCASAAAIAGVPNVLR
jgi:hypothetical protein